MLGNAAVEIALKEWRAEGYSANVAARRLIDEHEMKREDAIALVERIYGTEKAVRPYRAETAARVLANLGITGVGVAIAGWSYLHRASFPDSLFRFRWPMIVIGGAVIAGAGLARLARRPRDPRGRSR